MSAMMMWMILRTIERVMRAPGGKQRTGKKKQPQFSFSHGEHKRSIHN
jgi:hypothetical protein